MHQRGPIDIFIDQAVRCVICRAKMGKCACWERCSCGWYAENGKPCRNPETERCSTKVKYGKGLAAKKVRKGT